ncbi:core-2/I-branching beta-1,6-N-acetylglucosaminyltransferase family protein [Actinidia rufa]|uniref:Core-2/I-branching beta-1,6-N-acetylglucosaminyltransferase family protein n=1 Tax=Actinidia rufa TaxID=165716 RepID=A0A7J0DL07_9ERIC|nr:core-2/I-branching beta-1,6-N-acetylglucosaminyltransferase family protein [Actinidia rufa]
MKEMQILPAPRHRGQLKKPTWIIVLVSLVSLFLICAYIYPPHNSAACYVFSSNGCKGFSHWLPPAPAREFTDDEIASRVVIRDILSAPLESKNPKIAFLFLTAGALPFEKLWDKFFHLMMWSLPERDGRSSYDLSLLCSGISMKHGFITAQEQDAP